MQLTSLRTALAAASCGLLGIAPSAATAAADPAQVDSALLYYSEKDRVSVAEAAAIVTVPLADEETLTVIPIFDSITGASPNGATPTNVAQPFGVTTTTPAGQLPVQQFNDQRYALSLSWQYPIDRMNRSAVGAEFSTEKDYRSIGASYSRMRDFNEKLTTLTLGLSGSLDTVVPSGGIVPQGLTAVSTSVPTTTASVDAALVHTTTRASGIVVGGGSGSDGSTAPHEIRDKQVVDGMVGVTQVINRRTLMQFNYSLGFTTGYMTDPYKIISMVDGGTGSTTGYITELRPDFRLRQSLYWKTVLHLPQDVIHLSYRYYWDDWNIRSQTVDLHYHLKLGKSGYYLEPQLRYYTQSAADFYHHNLVNGAALPDFASADYRLAQMASHTYALKFAVPTGKDGELSARLMRMKQTGNSHPDDAIGVQRSLDLYPGLEATSLQFSWSFKF